MLGPNREEAAMRVPPYSDPDPASLPAHDRSLGRRLLDWLATPFQRQSALREWSALERDERSRIAHDLKMDSGEIEMVMQQGGGSAELSTLLDSTGLHRKALLSGMLPDLQRVCAMCTERGECREWQAVPMDAGAVLGVIPSFCPNREEIEALRGSKRR
jgi:hypothetical protein